ncbi:MAG: hypothetical protein LBQ50_11400, partial [Planctomycetaceae bacterium]|nr:hypothetical protein [Planctomycetaceae bacterium]
ITRSSSWTRNGWAIAYTFHSTYAYYPLAISAIGGTGRSLADLVVMTPDFEAEAKAKVERGQVTLIGNTSVDFTLNEVKSIDERLAKVFDGIGLNSVSVRNFLIPIKDIGHFNADFGAVSANNKSVNEEAKKNNRTLFVFGTKEQDILPVINESKKRLQQLCNTVDIPKDNITIIEGDEAAPENILEKCRELNDTIGKNGAVFVYILCKDKETKEEQQFFPLTESEIDLRNGILRKDIFETITKNEHRLSFLATDGCFRNDVQYSGGEASSVTLDPIYRFSALLNYGKGKYNLRAASPNRNEVPLGTAVLGTFFTNAFVNMMNSRVEDTGQFDIPALIKDMQRELDNIYQHVIIPNSSQKRQTVSVW